MPEGSAALGAVASIDPRPDTVEDVLNVCPQQAARFRGRHLRLAWVDSPPDPTQGWPGRQGPARVRVDTALRPQDPAVLIMPGPTAPARDPVVDLRACAIPPHFVQPWATIEVVRDSGAGAGGDEAEAAAEGDGDAAGEGRPASSPASAKGIASMPPVIRPEAALELLRGRAVRVDGVVHLLAAATDAACRGYRLLCRRAPEFVIPPPLPVPDPGGASAPSSRGGGGGGDAAGGHWSGKQQRGGVRPGGTGRRPQGGEGRGAGEQRQTGGVEATDAAVAATVGGGRRGRGCGGAPAGKGGAGEEGDWARRLSGWGVVTTGSEVVAPHKALEVWYRDARRVASSSSSSGEPAWVEAVLRSHEASVVDDISAGLGLGLGLGVDRTAPHRPGADGGGDAGEEAREEEDERRAADADAESAGNGALLVHGPPGVGKTRLVEALAARFGCRLVKVSPGRLVAAAGVQADRVLMEAFRYCRQCVSSRVVLLLDSIDRLTPAAEGGVGASRGEVDAAVLNAFVLAVEQGRRDPLWRGRVAVVGVTSWPDHVHPTARRCAGQEVMVLPPSQPLRAKILRHALRPAGEQGLRESMEASEERGESLSFASGDADAVESAVAEVVSLCQGFTAGDMCAVAAAALDLWTCSAGSQGRGGGDGGGGRRRVGSRQALSRGEALRAGFRQVRQRVAAGRGGASGGGGGGGGGGGSASVFGVPCVRWSEVGGLERAKRAVQEMVVWPAIFPEAFSRMGIMPATGVLLFGPPGTGKTLLAKAAATETGATFIELKISDVVRGEIGESEKAVDRAFRTARELAPSIVFIDEFQALFAARDVGGGTGSRLASQLLVCMDELARWRAAGVRVAAAAAAGGRSVGGAGDGRASPPPPSPPAESAGQSGGSANVMVLAATNAPEAVDAAFLRPGRFDEIVYAGLPDREGREHILRAAKGRMEEGLRTTGAAARPPSTPTSAQLSAGDDGNTTRNRGPDGDRDKVLPEALPEERTSAIAAAAAAAVASNNASAAAVAAAAAIEEPVRETTPLHPDTSSTERGGGGGGGGSGRSGGGGGRWARDVDVAWLSQQTKGYSGADLSSLVRNAAMVALREEGERVAEGVAVRPASTSGGSVGRSGPLVLARRHFETALESTKPSSGPEAVAKHERWVRQWHVA